MKCKYKDGDICLLGHFGGMPSEGVCKNDCRYGENQPERQSIFPNKLPECEHRRHSLVVPEGSTCKTCAKWQIWCEKKGRLVTQQECLECLGVEAVNVQDARGEVAEARRKRKLICASCERFDSKKKRCGLVPDGCWPCRYNSAGNCPQGLW